MAAALSGRSAVVIFILLGVASVVSSKETTVNIADMFTYLEEKFEAQKNTDNMVKAYTGLWDKLLRLFDTTKSLFKNEKQYHRLIEATEQLLLDFSLWFDDMAEKNAAEFKKTEESLQTLKKLVKIQQSLKGNPTTEQILKILKDSKKL